MADYILKPGQERFMVVDGPFEGRQYQPGTVYHDIPPAEAHRFAAVEAAPTPPRKGKADKETDQ